MLIHLLLVEDNPGDALLLRGMLDDQHPGQYTITTAETLGEAKAIIGRQAFDAVLLDLSLPDAQGLETIGRLVEAASHLPIVVLTGLADEEIAMEAVRHGAQDYLLKGQTDARTVGRAIRYAIDRKQAEEALHTKQRELELRNKELQETKRRLEAYRDRYIDLYDSAPLGYVTLDEEGYIQEINLAGAALLRKDRAELTGYPLADYIAEHDKQVFLAHLRDCCGGRREVTTELTMTAEDGQSHFVQLRSIPVQSSDLEDTFCKTAIADMTPRKGIE
jgi:PAS domain S-box-containing protein